MFTRSRLFWYVSAVVVTAFGLLFYAVQHVTAPTDTVPAAELFQAMPSADELKQAYEAKVPDILKRLNDGLSAPTGADRLAAVANARQDLLALTVPLAYKDLHLNLIIALSKIEAAERGGTSKLKADQATLQQVTASYPWLAGVSDGL